MLATTDVGSAMATVVAGDGWAVVGAGCAEADVTTGMEVVGGEVVGEAPVEDVAPVVEPASVHAAEATPASNVAPPSSS
ncbi:MAG: hypothetical protein JJD93_17750 [Ilumatobacteraceae bacterium]|nr:hypothetical protein [Ilumatobacteraceae bacterium]